MYQQRLNHVFHALADATRRKIVERLTHRDYPVMDLARQFAMSQPAVTKHLHVLERAGLIVRQKQGRQRLCRLQPKALERSQNWIENCRQFWNERLDALEQFLEQTHPRKESSHGHSK